VPQIQVKWSDFELQTLRDNYGKATYQQIASLLPGRTHWSVRNQASYLKLTGGSNLGRKYSVNKGFFDTPSPLNSYWAGFLAADGCLAREGARLSIGLAIKDVKHAERLRDDLGYTGPVSISKNSAAAHLAISCPELCDALMRNFALTPRKSLTLKPPRLDDPALVAAFICGLVDGDGSVTMGGSYPRILLYGTREITAWMRRWCDIWAPSTHQRVARERRIQRHLHCYGVSSSRAVRVAGKLLAGNHPTLERKWAVIRPFMSGAEMTTV